MHRGYIKLWRKIRDSWLIKDPHSLSLLTVLLLNAEWQDGKKVFFDGKQIELKAGQLTAGSKQLAEWTGQTRQNIRTSIKKLKATKIITNQVTNQYSLISILNFNSYQGQVTNQVTNPLTIDQPTPNQPLTTLEAFKNISIKEKESPASPAPLKNVDESKQICLKDVEIKDQSEAVKHKIFNQIVDAFKARGWRTEPEYVKNVLKAIVARLEDYSPKDFFPYFKKAAQNYINQNAEAFAQDAAIARKNAKPLGVTIGGVVV